MFMVKKLSTLFAIVPLAGLCGACGAAKSDDVGSANVEIGSQALSASDVTSVQLQITAQDMTSPLQQQLTKSGTTWAGIVGGIPVGANRVFKASAYQGQTVVYEGQAAATIQKGMTTFIIILLQQKTPSAAFANAVPIITSATTSSSQIAPTETITVAAAAQDSNGDPLTWLWNANAGSFSAASSATTQWTAPSNDGSYALTATVSDGKNGTASVTLNVSVNAQNARGTANVNATFNTWPVVTSVAASPDDTGSADGYLLTAVASDSDLDALSYLWSDNCSGSFSSATAASSAWTPPTVAPTSGSCTVSVTASDGRGGHGTGSATIELAPALTGREPVVTFTYQSMGTALPGEKVTFDLNITNPEGGAVTLIWGPDASDFDQIQSDFLPDGETTVASARWSVPMGDGPFDAWVAMRNQANLHLPLAKVSKQHFVVTKDTSYVARSSMSIVDDIALDADEYSLLAQTIIPGVAGRVTGVEFAPALFAALQTPHWIDLSVLQKSENDLEWLAFSSARGQDLLVVSRPAEEFPGMSSDRAGTGYMRIDPPIEVTQDTQLVFTLTCSNGVLCKDTVHFGYNQEVGATQAHLTKTVNGQSTELTGKQLAFKLYME